MKLKESTTLSWSFFESYNQCPLKFYHKYILGEKEPSNMFALYGSAMHALLEHIYTEKKFDSKYGYFKWPIILQKEYKTQWKQYQYGHIPQKEVDQMKFVGFKHLKNFYNLAIKEDILREPLFIEEKLNGVYGGLKITGRLDIGFRTKLGVTLLDWKTGSEDLDSLRQLVLYALLYEQNFNQKIDAVGLAYLKLPKLIIEPLNKGLISKTGGYLKGIYNAILEHNECKPKKNAYCKTCHLYRNKCNVGGVNG